MYKFLLSWRYLKTRFIALASIISVTLGVATLIVVNSVMSGFVDEMKDRLHGILSDVEISAPGLGEIPYPDRHIEAIEEVAGDNIESITTVVRVPALMNFEFRGRQWTQQVMLLGIDEQSFGQVTDFLPYLMNSRKQNRLSFLLEESGYDQRLGNAGWEHRRIKARNQKELDRWMKRATDTISPEIAYDKAATKLQTNFQSLPVEGEFGEEAFEDEKQNFEKIAAVDSRAHLRQPLTAEEMFDAEKDQYTGCILGMAISNRKFIDAETGQRDELFMLRPGDDIQITLPTSGNSPQPVTENCTVVDFYSSNMHEYDSSFAFMPLRKLQEVRKM
ncbi:MAG: ABC transporter permease, partial [Planctomycetota bacterium]